MRGEQLDREATTLFALEQYRSLKHFTGRPFYYHPRKVSKIAEAMAYRHLLAKSPSPIYLPPADMILVHQVWHAGWLHDVMEMCSATFDDVAHLTNMEVAQWVAGGSADVRLPWPRRLPTFCCQLASQPDLVKIIRLADLGNNLDELLTFIRFRPDAAKTMVGNWPEYAMRILEAIVTVRHLALTDEFLWCEQAAAALADCARQPQQATLIAGGVCDCPIRVPRKKRRRRRRARGR